MHDQPYDELPVRLKIVANRLTDSAESPLRINQRINPAPTITDARRALELRHNAFLISTRWEKRTSFADGGWTGDESIMELVHGLNSASSSGHASGKRQ